jgi:hypothetical protein
VSEATGAVIQTLGVERGHRTASGSALCQVRRELGDVAEPMSADQRMHLAPAW